MIDPSPSDSNGRAANGRFAAGNRFARGNPHAQRVGKLRSAILTAATPRDVSSVLATMRDCALAGDTAAARIYLEYAVGKPDRVHDDEEERENWENREWMHTLELGESQDYSVDDLELSRLLHEMTAHSSIQPRPALPHQVIDAPSLTSTGMGANPENP